MSTTASTPRVAPISPISPSTPNICQGVTMVIKNMHCDPYGSRWLTIIHQRVPIYVRYYYGECSKLIGPQKFWLYIKWLLYIFMMFLLLYITTPPSMKYLTTSTLCLYHDVLYGYVSNIAYYPPHPPFNIIIIVTPPQKWQQKKRVSLRGLGQLKKVGRIPHLI